MVPPFLGPLRSGAIEAPVGRLKDPTVQTASELPAESGESGERARGGQAEDGAPTRRSGERGAIQPPVGSLDDMRDWIAAIVAAV